MLLKKQNVFDDFIAAAEYLDQGEATRARAPRRSAAARTAGCSSARRSRSGPTCSAPSLCGVPLLDMVRYHLFGSGKTWIPEYGSADDAEQFKALYAYSPYHHVKAGTKYPPCSCSRPTATTASTRCTRASSPRALQAATTGGPGAPAHREARRPRRRRPGEGDRRARADEYAFALCGDSGERRWRRRRSTEVTEDPRTLAAEVARRRTFAIISHPDAGKTTLTEKLLLYGGAIQLAGAVKAQERERATRERLDGDGARARHLDHDERPAVPVPRATR